jgi:PAS domain S-box-containing protein
LNTSRTPGVSGFMITPATPLSQIDLMSAIVRNPIVVTAETTVMAAIAHMRDADDHALGAADAGDAAPVVHLAARSSCVLVVEGKTVCGMLTERDIVCLSVQGRSLDRVTVREVMSAPVFWVCPDDLRRGVPTILELRSRRCWVAMDSQGSLLGIITPASLLQALNPLVRYTAALRAQAEREQVMSNIAVKIAASQSLSEVLDTTVQELRSLLGCDRLVIVQFQPDASGVVMAESVDAGWHPILQDVIDAAYFRDGLLERYAAGRAIANETIHTAGYAPGYVQLLERYQVQSNLVVPIRVSNRLWGLLIGHQCAARRAWRDSDLTLLDKMTVQIAIAIQQATAYQQVQTELAERQRAEVARRQSEQRFRAIFDNTFQFMGLLSPDGTLLEVNQTALVAGGVAHADVVGRPFWETHWWRISPATRVQLQQAIVQAAAGKFVRYEVDVLGTQGQTMTIDFSLRPIIDDQGQVLLLIPEGRDITDLKQARQALEVQIKFDRLVANISNRLIQLTPQAMTAGINQALQDIGEFSQVDTSYIFRYADGQCTHRMTHEWVAPDLEPHLSHAQDVPLASFPWSTICLSQEQIVHISSMDNLPPAAAIDQQTFRRIGIKSTLSIPLITRGCVIGLVGFATLRLEHCWTDDTIRLLKIFADILTSVLQRQQVEANFQASEQRYAALAKSAPVGIFRTDREGNCLYVNQLWCQIAGLTLAEAAGFGWMNGIYPDDRALVTMEWNAAVQEERPFSLEYRFQNLAGQITWVYGQAVSEQDAAGENIGYVGTITDISDRRQAETALIQSEARSRAILTAIPDLMFRVGSDGTYREIARRNPQIDILGGRDPMGLAMTDVLPMEIAARNLHYINRAIATGELQVYEQQVAIGDRWQIEEVRVVKSSDDEALLIIRDISDRKQAEADLQQLNQALEMKVAQRTAALQASEATHRATLEAIPDRLLRLRRDGTCVEYIKPIIPFDQVLPTVRHIADVLPPALLPGLLKTIEQAIVTHELQVYEHHFYQHDCLVHEEVRAIAINDDEVLMMMRDISDRKRAEQELQKSQQFVQKIAEASPNILYIYDLKKQCSIYCNREITSVLGYTPTEVQAMGAELGANLMHPEDRAKLPKHYAKIEAAEDGQIFELEYRMRHINGEWRWLYSRSSVFSRDQNGQVKLTIGAVQDMSDRKQAEVILRNLSDRLTVAVKAGAIGIWDWDITQDRLTWDDRMFELYAITPTPFTIDYATWASRLHPDDRPIAEAATQSALAGEEDYDLEFRVVHPDQSIRFIQASALIKRNDQGEPQRMIGINFDITDRKQAERHLLRTSAQLEASNRELEAFAYSVSHDLRGPLRAIDGFSMALLEDCGDQFDADGRDYLDRIRRNVNRMGLLIDDLLRLSRVSRSEIQYGTVNLSVLVQEQLEDLQASEPGRQVTVVIAPAAIVSADATLMRVVLTNLLQNAWKFTSHHATARIEFGVLQGGEELTYFVRDDGAGFDMAYDNMLFGVFQRLHNTHEFPGTGIGLATVQRAIHRHGGRVWAEAAVEQGATIYFTVPNLFHNPQGGGSAD